MTQNYFLKKKKNYILMQKTYPIRHFCTQDVSNVAIKNLFGIPYEIEIFRNFQEHNLTGKKISKTCEINLFCCLVSA